MEQLNMTDYYERYVISELPPKSILDQNTGDTIPLNDEGVFETICELLNRQNIIMESRNETIKFHVDEYNKLKQTIQEVTELLEEEVDLFSDKATEHDINAYVELNELDNKDAFYMAKATKTAIKLLNGDME